MDLPCCLFFRSIVVYDSLWPHGLQHTRPPCSSQSPKFAEVHVNGISDAIQPSRPLMPSSPSALNLSHNQDFFNELAVRNRWPKYWSFSFSISPSTEYSRLTSLKIDLFDLLAVQGTLTSPLMITGSILSITEFTISLEPKSISVHYKKYVDLPP